MSQLFKFDLNKTKEGNFEELHQHGATLKNRLSEGKANFSLADILTSCMVNPIWNAKFTENLNRELGYNPRKGVNFDITTTTIAGQISTEVMGTIEALIKDTSILSGVTIHDLQPNEFKQLWEYDIEKDAENLAEQAAGTEADEVMRTDDKLIAKTKVQASTTITELALYTFDAVELSILVARLIRRVQRKLINNILYSGNGVSNGTARSAGTIRGIVNNYGVNGTGDAANYIGAISYATKSAADTALGSASADEYDLAVKVKRILLPNALDDVEERDYSYIMNRQTWGKISTVEDANGRYKAQSAIDPSTGKATKQIDGTSVELNTEVTDDFVFLVPLKLYHLALTGGIRALTDDGTVELKEGNITFVTRTYADGSMLYGQKYASGTAATIGTTAVDNQQMNAFRYFKIV